LLPFSLLHIDTGYNFPEVESFLLEIAEKHSIQMFRFKVPSQKAENINRAQSHVLKEAVAGLELDALLGGARRDEDAARAKEKFFSRRNGNSEWNPEDQVAEFWNITTCQCLPNQHYRVFPLNNWRERDIWSYIQQENINLPSLYYAHQRTVSPLGNQRVRCRTMGDQLTTTFHPSEAQNSKEVLEELLESELSERSGRLDDNFSCFSMEIRKREGYF
ncbi:sulfate adenylyltransferase subunit CysD, partial [bacterium]|nr:sulfate adenylyltransferase subunit CysD [bacterium]